MELIGDCVFVFLGHVLIHTLILVFIVPLFGRAKSVTSTETYRSCSSRIACSWFSANPINCLRSQYKYGHRPPCDYFMAGKEHLLRVNESIGLYFNDTPLEVEDFDVKAGVQVKGFVKEFSQRAMKYLPRRWSTPVATPAKQTQERFDVRKNKSNPEVIQQGVGLLDRARSDTTSNVDRGGSPSLPQITERPSPEVSPRA